MSNDTLLGGASATGATDDSLLPTFVLSLGLGSVGALLFGGLAGAAMWLLTEGMAMVAQLVLTLITAGMVGFLGLLVVAGSVLAIRRGDR